MSFRNILISLVMVCVAIFGATKSVMYFHAKKKIDSILEPMQDIMDVSYQGISTSIFGPVGIQGLKIRSFDGEEMITFGKVILESFDKEKSAPIPHYVNITFENVRFDTRFIDDTDIEDVPEFVNELGYNELYVESNNLRALGYDHIISDINFEFSYKKEHGGVKVKLSEDIEKLGQFDMLLDFIGFVPGMHAMDMKTKIRGINLKFQDDSYTDRLLNRFAKKNNLQVDEYREQLIAKLNGYLHKNKIVLEKKDVAALKRFIKKPGKLTISIQPYKPVSIENLKYYKREDVPNLLNLTINATNEETE